jgi:eukaryotic-like serine/threonine-protein kinase
MKLTTVGTRCSLWYAAKKSRVRTILAQLLLLLVLIGCTNASTRSISDTRTGSSAVNVDSRSRISIYRANPQRTGEYTGDGIADSPKLLWRYTSGERITSPPVVTDDRVFFTANDGYLHVLEAKTGREKWRVQAFNAPPTIVDDILYYGWRNLFAVDGTTQKEIWESETHGIAVESSPLIADGLVYFGADDGNLYATDKDSGKVMWMFKAGVRVNSHPAILEGTIFFDGIDLLQQGTDTGIYQGTIFALDAKTGEQRWAFKPEGGAFSPLVATGAVYCIGAINSPYSEGYIYSLDPITGKELWKHRPTGDVVAPLAFAEGVLYMASESGNLAAIDVATRKELWTFKVDTFIANGPSTDDKFVYFSSGDSHLYALNKKSGRFVWKFNTEGVVRTPLVLHNGTAYFVDDKWNLYAIR